MQCLFVWEITSALNGKSQLFVSTPGQLIKGKKGAGNMSVLAPTSCQPLKIFMFLLHIGVPAKETPKNTVVLNMQTLY